MDKVNLEAEIKILTQEQEELLKKKQEALTYAQNCEIQAIHKQGGIDALNKILTSLQ